MYGPWGTAEIKCDELTTTPNSYLPVPLGGEEVEELELKLSQILKLILSIKLYDIGIKILTAVLLYWPEQ